MSKRKAKENNELDAIDNSPNKGVALISNSPREYSVYEAPAYALMNAINAKEENYNIGIIGSFGSGKSSLLKKYKSLNNKQPSSKRRKIVSVSLASFSNDSHAKTPDNNSNDKNNEYEQYLESIIIQQILYSVSKYKLPSSRINRIGFRIRTIVLFVCATLCALFFIAANNTSLLQVEKIPNIKTYCYIIGAILSIITATVFFMCYPITSIVAKIKNVEIKSEPNISSTLFDEYLDELLYFFHKTRTTVVIFEDIDRCSIETIFSKLRTLNITLNNNKWFSKRKNKIHFVYAVKEDLFISSEIRSKFFDVLISLPALLSQDNALNHINAILKEHNISSLDKDFLSHIATYIISYRQINNIVNDYILMNEIKYKNIAIDTSTAKNLFAILAYKSIFPFDYLQFLKCDGYLYCYINKTESKELPRLDAYYLKVYGTSTPRDEIKRFYELLSNYFDATSLSLVSNFVKGEYENDEQKIFYDRLKANPDFYNAEIVYSDPKTILNHANSSQNANSNSFLNISLIEAAFLFRPKYNSFLNAFAKSFTNKTKNQKDFIEKCGLLVEEKTDFVYSFFKLIAPIYTSLALELKLSSFFKNTKTIKRFLKQVIGNKNNASLQNAAVIFSDVFANCNDTDTILCGMDEEFRQYMLSSNFKIKSINISSYFKNSFKNYKTALYELITNNRFILNLETYNKIGVVVSDHFGINAPPIAAIAYASHKDERLKPIRNELKVFIEEGKYPTNEFGDYANCSTDVVIESLKAFESQKLQDQIIGTCNIIALDDPSILEIMVIEKLLAKYKIKAPVSAWWRLGNLSTNLKDAIIRNIFDDYESLLIDEKDKNQNYHDFLYLILNDERCTYALAGKILEITCDIFSLSLSRMTNQASIKCSIDFGYIDFEENDLNLVPMDYLVAFYEKYESVIESLPNVISVDEERIEYLLRNCDKNKRSLIICRTISIVDQRYLFVQNYTNDICQNISIFSSQFLSSFMVCPLIKDDNRVEVLIASYSRIESLKDILDKFKNQKISFVWSDSFGEFKKFISSHKTYGYTFQYNKKKDNYVLRKLNNKKLVDN